MAYNHSKLAIHHCHAEVHVPYARIAANARAVKRRAYSDSSIGSSGMNDWNVWLYVHTCVDTAVLT